MPGRIRFGIRTATSLQPNVTLEEEINDPVDDQKVAEVNINSPSRSDSSTQTGKKKRQMKRVSEPTMASDVLEYLKERHEEMKNSKVEDDKDYYFLMSLKPELGSLSPRMTLYTKVKDSATGLV